MKTRQFYKIQMQGPGLRNHWADLEGEYKSFAAANRWIKERAGSYFNAGCKYRIFHVKQTTEETMVPVKL